MGERIYKFQADIPGDMVSYESYPVYDEYQNLAGAFTLIRGSLIGGFISGVGYPLALKVSTDEAFYFTAIPSTKTGRVESGMITEKPVNGDSIKVTCAHEETQAEQQS